MSNTTEIDRLAYSVPDAARMLGISPRAIYNRLANGELRSFRVGPRRLISLDALKDYIRTRESEAS